MRRWIRRTLRLCGIELPFRHVVCPEQVRSVIIGADWCAKVTVQSTLVFLAVPEDGDLRDVLPVDPHDRQTQILASPDAHEVGRRRTGQMTVLYWRPRQPVVPYSLYRHQQSWSSSEWGRQRAIYAELRCEMRTGTLALEIAAPVIFDAAVAFRRPRWRRFRSERSLVKYALRQLESATSARPRLRDGGQRLEWKVVGPRVGDRYICVAFSQDGLQQWQRELKERSFIGRVRALVGLPVPS